MSADPTIRRELRAGDLGAIIAHHGRLYPSERGVDASFEAHVAASVAAGGVLSSCGTSITVSCSDSAALC